MARILAALLMALTLAAGMATSAGAQDAKIEALNAQLPPAPGEWSTTGSKTKVVAEGPSKGVIVFQVYQKGPRTVIVRFTENPPELVARILVEPGTYNYKPMKIKDRDVIIKDETSSGTVLTKLENILVSVDWSGAATREDAMRFIEAIDFEKLAEVK